jgi:SAM-dependent methyltransferase
MPAEPSHPSLPLACPLCGARSVSEYAHVHGRDYLLCPVCRLTFLSPGQRLASDEEHARYALHRNDPADAGYRAFLDRLATPLAARLPAGAEGLDYGSGPGPALAVMLEERGFVMRIFDPFFANEAAVLERVYDFITCTETVEHFFEPAAEFRRFDRLLRPGGWLAIMTELRREERSFAEWWYVRDPTHVCFYQQATFEWIAAAFGWTLDFPHPNVPLFRKAAAPETDAPPPG